MNEAGKQDGAALEDILCIDLTRVLGGPFATMILADQGARIVKVEPPTGDDTREWGPPFRVNEDGTKDSSYFLGVNRNKQSIALDLANPLGRGVLKQVLSGADILIENFRPGTMEKWQLDYPLLREQFPRLVYCRLSGFGSDGPMATRPGYDAVIQGMSGLMSINGTPESGPTRVGTAVVDMVSGLYCANAILMALHERTRSGRGQFIDIALFDCALTLLHPHIANYFLTGQRPVATGNSHPNIAPYDRYRTRTGYIVVTSGSQAQFHNLCSVLNMLSLAEDERFKSNEERVTHRTELNELLQERLLHEDGEVLCERLMFVGVPAGKVQCIDKVIADPQIIHRDMILKIGEWTGINTPIKFSRSQSSKRSEPPSFGCDTESILRTHGYSEKEICDLKNAGVALCRKRSIKVAPVALRTENVAEPPRSRGSAPHGADRVG